MQVEERRACPSCGADNPAEAGFCWQCYASFAPAQPPKPLPTTAGWGPTGTPAPPAPVSSAARAGGAGRFVKMAVGVVVGLVVAATVRNMLTPDYHVPETIGTMPRIQSAATDDFEQQMRAEGSKEQIDLEAAAYGRGVEPEIFFVLANGSAVENTDELFREFLDGMESAGATIDRADAVTGSHEGAEFRCIPVHARTLTAAACIWREDASVGLTMDLDAGTDITETITAAYDASHA
jgi:hypothetical protein